MSLPLLVKAIGYLFYNTFSQFLSLIVTLLQLVTSTAQTLIGYCSQLHFGPDPFGDVS